jgi:AcrR family transcriptional regulator
MQTLKEEVRESILDSAAKAFFDEGFEKASMRSIAQEAGISAANLYSYFASKDALFAAVAEPAAAVLREALEEFLARESLSAWTSDAFAQSFEEEVSSSLGRLLSSHGQGFALLMSAGGGTASEGFRPELEARLARNFGDDIARGPIGRAPDPLVMRIVAANLLDGLVRIVRESPRKPQLQERVRSLMRYNIAGIRGLMK